MIEQLDVTIAGETSTTTLLRVDADVQWLDPHPFTVKPYRPTTHLVVGAACPSVSVELASTGADLHWQLLPSDDPTAAMLCTYPTLGSTRPPARRLLDGAAAIVLARAVQAVSLSNDGVQVHTCPDLAAPPGPSYVAFRYPSRPDVDLVVDRSCFGASNGVIAADGGSGFDVLDQALLKAAK